MTGTGPAAIFDRLDPPQGIFHAAVAIASETGLWPAEAQAIAGAVPARHAEFAAGRQAARAALGQMDVPACAIPVGPGRAPVWPSGVVGSISHDAGLAAAIVGPADRWQGLGLDIARRVPIDAQTAAVILRPDDPETDPLATFSAKEAAFKAQFPATETWLSYDAAQFDPAGGVVRFADMGETKALPKRWRDAELPIYQLKLNDWIVTVCAIGAKAL